MAITNHERVGKALDMLKEGLGPYIEREFTNVYQDKAKARAKELTGEDKINARLSIKDWDAGAPKGDVGRME